MTTITGGLRVTGGLRFKTPREPIPITLGLNDRVWCTGVNIGVSPYGPASPNNTGYSFNGGSVAKVFFDKQSPSYSQWLSANGAADGIYYVEFAAGSTSNNAYINLESSGPTDYTMYVCDQYGNAISGIYLLPYTIYIP